MRASTRRQRAVGVGVDGERRRDRQGEEVVRAGDPQVERDEQARMAARALEPARRGRPAPSPATSAANS